MTEPSGSKPRRAVALAALGVIALSLWAVLRLAPGSPSSPPEPAAPPRAERAPAKREERAVLPRGTTSPEAPSRAPQARPEASDAPAGGRLARARSTLASYATYARYPPTSRPLREHPDQIEPHHVENVTLRLRRADKKLTDARVTTRQSRLYVVGDDEVELGLRCENTDGVQPCQVLKATARAGGDPTVALSPEGSPVPFSPGDDGWAAARFRPKDAFAGHRGSVHVDVLLRVGSEEGSTGFVLQLTPEAPATFTGKVNESLSSGSVALDVEMLVKKPGRYVVTGRVDDADGKPLSLVTFNEELAEGARSARLVVFGKLALDEHAKSPFRLRDVEGFLLDPSGDSDRLLMPSLLGPVHTTRAYAEGELSPDEWQSEEKERHLKEFRKDLVEAGEGGSDKGSPAASAR